MVVEKRLLLQYVEKIALAKLKKTSSIDVWGDGNQTRSFMYIDDCIHGTKMVFNSNSAELIILVVTNKFQLIK